MPKMARCGKSWLPARRETSYNAWVTIQIGCDNSCAFCIVPSVRGVEISRPCAEIVAEVRENFGLDKPWYVQYGLFVKRLVVGDEYGWPGLGFSYVYRVPVKDLLFERLPISFQLAVGGAVVWLAVGIPIGILSALKRRSIADRVVMTFALIGVPGFRLALNQASALDGFHEPSGTGRASAWRCSATWTRSRSWT